MRHPAPDPPLPRGGRPLAAVLLLAGAALAAGCAPTAGGAASLRASARHAAPEQRQAIVLDAESFAGRTESVLQAIRGRIAGMEVRRTGGCPEVTLRGRKSINMSNNPVVYVDGARLSDTCVLESMMLLDLDRIEVYPMGVTNRPGYRSSPNGLILLFTMRAGEAQ